MARETLEDLVDRYLRDADEEAAEEVVRRTRPKLLAVARRIGSLDEAEDAVHTAYLSLLHKRGGPLDAPVMPWLVTAVVRIAYRHKAQHRRQHELSRRLAHLPQAPTPAAAAMRAEEFRRLRDGVDRLAAGYRDPVVLHYFEGLTTNEVAGLLGITQSAVKKRLQRARTLLLGSLAPWLALPLLAVPWFLADCAHASSQLILGEVMKYKTAVIVTAAVAATGIVGVGIGAALPGKSDAEPAQRVARAQHGPDLHRELETSRERERELLAQLEAARAASKEQPAAEAHVAEEGRVRRTLDPKLQRAAQALKVPAPALQAALEAEEAVRNQHQQDKLDEEALEAIEKLNGHGEQGLLALLALLRGGRQGAWFERLLREAWSPGYEAHLITAAGDPAFPRSARYTVLRAMGAADTPETRRYLLDLVAESEDAGLFYSAAGALGELREPAGAPHFEDKLLRPGWDGVRPYLLGALGKMGGPRAERILLDFLAHPRAGDHFYAIAALVQIDPEAGSREAARYLGSRPREEVSEVLLPYLEAWAGIKPPGSG